MAKVRILSIDGGGVRGIFVAEILAMLSQKKDILAGVDIIAGTSTGALIALCLANGYTPEQISTFYAEFSKGLFSSHAGFLSDIDLRAKYQNDGLKKILEKKIFSPELKFSDLKIPVIIPTFKLYKKSAKNWSPVVFDTFDEDKAEKLSVVDIALRATAAPGFFPSYQGYIDGGVIANNPSMVALSGAIDKEKWGFDVNDVSLLSIGTGKNPGYIERDVNWGLGEWVVHTPRPNPPTPSHPLISILWDAVSVIPHEQCGNILQQRYKRVNPTLGKIVSLDDWEKIDYLKKKASDFPKECPDDWESLEEFIKVHF